MSEHDSTIGACSLCGGPVQIPRMWFGAEPPRPRCMLCRAESTSLAPVIEMRPRNRPMPATDACALPEVRYMRGTSGAPVVDLPLPGIETADEVIP